jgi:3-dehydroquinate synthase
LTPVDQIIENVQLNDRSYEIVINTQQESLFHHHLQMWLSSKPHLQLRQPKAFFIGDENTKPILKSLAAQLANQHWTVGEAIVPAGEASKSLDQLSGLYDRLVAFEADRRTIVIAVGGGVVGDLAGYAAASFNRGQPFVQVPTTLLATVDSSVGGKVGINHPRAKNLIGAFHQPLGVWIDTAYFNSLPDREFFSGMAEVVKYGVIMDANFFHELERDVHAINRRDPAVLRHMIAQSCRLKADVVQQDEYERTGLRAILNYGHTFAHAYEALVGYGTLLHGEAVSIGMVAASQLAEKLQRITPDVTLRQKNLLAQFNLPIELPANCKLDADSIIRCMKLDKKTVGGELRFILPTRLGYVETVPSVPEHLVREVLNA